ncbi:unnamed protein product [Allacma fusca]|uniref:Secreted protein n=1 Tax=Allacma fusca TaxID=39272 RepID=A0A8J2IZ73_9HEXA|nr:unnamed protein product [Allacma fusca]
MVSTKVLAIIAMVATLITLCTSMPWTFSQPELLMMGYDYPMRVAPAPMDTQNKEQGLQHRMWAPWSYAAPAGRGRFHTGGSSY